MGVSMLARLHAERRDQLLGELRAARRASGTCARPMRACSASTMFSRTDRSATMPLCLRSSGQNAEAVLRAHPRDSSSFAGWPSMRISPESRSSSANSRRASSVRPEPSKPARPEHLAGAQFDVHGLELAAARQVARGEHRRCAPPSAGGRAASRIVRRTATSRPTMAATRPRASSLRAGVFADEPAIAQHRHAIADLVHLVEEMRDEQDGHALVAQPADQREQRLDFLGVEARGGLVEDQHARIGGDGARHGGELLQRRRAGRPRAASRRARCRGRLTTRARACSVSRQSMPPPRVQGRRG